MVPARARPFLPAEIYSSPDILSGTPCVRDTHVPAETIAAYIRDGYSDREIFEDYPSLPIDGIDAVRLWATENGISLGRE